MKTLFFSLIVLLSGYYLLSQTDSGQTLLTNFMPSQQIEQTTDELLNKVDSRLQDFTNSQAAEQNTKIEQLQQQVEALSTLLANQQAMLQRKDLELAQHTKTKVDKLTTATTDSPEEANKTDNDQLQLPPDLSQIKGQTASYTPNPTSNSTIDFQRADTLANKSLQRQKQAYLQDIAARMEQVSLQISNGNY